MGRKGRGKGGPFLVLLQAQFNHLPPGRPEMVEVWDCREPSKTEQLLSPRAGRLKKHNSGFNALVTPTLAQNGYIKTDTKVMIFEKFGPEKDISSQSLPGTVLSVIDLL